MDQEITIILDIPFRKLVDTELRKLTNKNYENITDELTVFVPPNIELSKPHCEVQLIPFGENKVRVAYIIAQNLVGYEEARNEYYKLLNNKYAKNWRKKLKIKRLKKSQQFVPTHVKGGKK